MTVAPHACRCCDPWADSTCPGCGGRSVQEREARLDLLAAAIRLDFRNDDPDDPLRRITWSYELAMLSVAALEGLRDDNTKDTAAQTGHVTDSYRRRGGRCPAHTAGCTGRRARVLGPDERNGGLRSWHRGGVLTSRRWSACRSAITTPPAQ